MTVYISGPISGFPDGNLPAFLVAREVWRSEGVNAIIPHEIVAPIIETEQAMFCPAYRWCACMVSLLPIVENVDGIVMLPGWPQSKGAMREFKHAIEHKVRVYWGTEAAPILLDESDRVQASDNKEAYWPGRE